MNLEKICSLEFWAGLCYSLANLLCRLRAGESLSNGLRGAEVKSWRS